MFNEDLFKTIITLIRDPKSQDLTKENQVFHQTV